VRKPDGPDCVRDDPDLCAQILSQLGVLDELPAEFIVHPRIVVSRKTGEQMLCQAEAAEPTPALRDLMRDGAG
jgi:hypothetical protein